MDGATLGVLLMYLLFSVLGILIMAFITRAIFSIPKFIKLQHAQLQILTEIAKKHDVKNDVIYMIYENLGLYLRHKTNEETKEELEKFKSQSIK